MVERILEIQYWLYLNIWGYVKKIYAWECDEINGKVILDKFGNDNRVNLIPKAMYKENTKIRFTSKGDSTSSMDKNGEIVVEADSIDNLCPDATFIKMDIEGAEIDALYGAKNTIIKNKPKLAICLYHEWDHLYQIPLLIHQWVPEYKFYVRHHANNTTETVLYAKL
jgi:FkbM family methyltransferase